MIAGMPGPASGWIERGKQLALNFVFGTSSQRMTMTYDAAFENLRTVARRHGMYDAEWIRELDDSDEPPLYYRLAEVEFVRGVERVLRGPLVVRWVVEVLDVHADLLSTLADRNRYLLYATFLDCDLWQAGEQPVPKPCIFVDPEGARNLTPGFQLRAPTSETGCSFRDWIRDLKRDDLLVAEPQGFDIRCDRIYLGYTNPRGFLSVNTYYSEE